MSISKKQRSGSNAEEVVHDLKEKQEISDDFSSNTGPKFGCRHVQAMLMCLALVFGVGTRTNLSVAIVAMTDNTTTSNPEVPAYNWTNTSVILSSFFWSYVILQVLAGYLGKAYGPKNFLLATFFVNCCACAATPLAASMLGSSGVIICRVLQGLCQGFLYPSISVMVGTWVPKEERTTLNNCVFSGVQIGSIYASLLTGYVSSSWLGWPYSFYILSFMGFLWCILWIFLGQNSPATHPSITMEEKKYIQQSLKQEDEISLPTPWKKIFTCLPFYAIMVAYIGNIWGYAIMMTETPTYLSKIMDYDLKSDAVVNTLPTAAALVSGLITGPLSDWLIGRNYLSTLNARRTFHAIGSYGQALCLVWLAYLTKSEAYLSIVALTLVNGLTSCVLVGCNVNHLDLSPRFSGVLFGILNGVGQCASIAAPLVAQWLLTDVTDIIQWRILFLISAGFYVVGATVFIIFASATRQTWDGPKEIKLAEKKKRLSIISIPGT